MGASIIHKLSLSAVVGIIIILIIIAGRASATVVWTQQTSFTFGVEQDLPAGAEWRSVTWCIEDRLASVVGATMYAKGNPSPGQELARIEVGSSPSGPFMHCLNVPVAGPYYINATLDTPGASDYTYMDIFPDCSALPCESGTHANATWESQTHANATWESQAHANATWESQAHANATWESQAHANATWCPIANANCSGNFSGNFTGNFNIGNLTGNFTGNFTGTVFDLSQIPQNISVSTLFILLSVLGPIIMITFKYRMVPTMLAIVIDLATGILELSTNAKNTIDPGITPWLLTFTILMILFESIFLGLSAWHYNLSKSGEEEEALY